LTFVYREIEALVAAGYKVKTVSMGRPPISQISEEAIPYYHSTLYLDQYNLLKKILAFVRVVYSKPGKCMKLLIKALSEKEIKGFKDRTRLLYHYLESAFLYDLLKKTKLQHIHAHFLSGPASIACFLSDFLEIPFSFTMHASSIFTDHIMLQHQLRTCKKAVTISEYNKKYLIQTYGNVFENKIDVIHCGIDMQAFKPLDSNKLSPPIILAIGQLFRRKGFLYLVKACKKLKQNGNQFQCWIVGDGPEKSHLKRTIERYQIHGDVLLLGRQSQENVKTYLQKASVFVLPSIITEEGGREGIPVAIMEAMAMQIPVVSTHTAGIPELIQHEKEGLLVDQKNEHQLAAALEYFLKNPEIGLKMGRQGRMKVEEQFNLGHVPELFSPIFN
jgi:glycosyltransferase involved in cell wall biosynthesis